MSGSSDARIWCWRKSQLTLTNGDTRTKSGRQLLSTAGQPARLPVVARSAPLEKSLPGPEGVVTDARQSRHLKQERERRCWGKSYGDGVKATMAGWSNWKLLAEALHIGGLDMMVVCC